MSVAAHGGLLHYFKAPKLYVIGVEALDNKVTISMDETMRPADLVV
jgi:hypothetical protein